MFKKNILFFNLLNITLAILLMGTFKQFNEGICRQPKGKVKMQIRPIEIDKDYCILEIKTFGNDKIKLTAIEAKELIFYIIERIKFTNPNEQ
jgi:hypothetical protein